MALDAGYIRIAIGWSACTLAFPDHLAQAIHGFVMRLVQGIAFCREEFNGLANAARLVNRALFADGKVHGKVQEGVGLPTFNVIHFFKGSIRICKIGVIFRVLLQPLVCYGFNSFHGLIGPGFSVDRTKKTANIGL